MWGPDVGVRAPGLHLSRRMRTSCCRPGAGCRKRCPGPAAGSGARRRAVAYGERTREGHGDAVLELWTESGQRTDVAARFAAVHQLLRQAVRRADGHDGRQPRPRGGRSRDRALGARGAQPEAQGRPGWGPRRGRTPRPRRRPRPRTPERFRPQLSVQVRGEVRMDPRMETYGPMQAPSAAQSSPESQAWMRGTTEAPSPLAEATRFIEPARMSPTANTPGTDVARSAGGRPSIQYSRGTSRPVQT